jgi:hypothetical protein
MSAARELSPLDQFVEQLEFSPGSPDWRRMPEWKRTLAAFAALMHDQVSDGLINAPWSDDTREYVAALRAMGATHFADALQTLSSLDPSSEMGRAALVSVSAHIERDWESLWTSAEAYAKANGWCAD